ncbi:MAG: hypothetical protein IJA44_03640 [Clostridia bacterium]|nr:hypothetical protein [Clostridia bacterium]
MKYSNLSPKGIKCFKLPVLNGGINANARNDNALIDGKNIWFNDGRLKTRPGLSASGENTIVVPKKSIYDEFDYRLHDVKINYLDSEYRIGTIGVCNDDFRYTLYIYFIASGTNILPVGNLEFLRISSDNFKVPDNITFYTGTPQSGGGIFALITLKNLENYDEKSYNIYEINSEFTQWERVYDFYAPTLLINGRGNNYDLAYSEKEISAFSPVALESQNLLNGRFNVYFTSDGRSNMFRLPLANLSLESVVCRINYTASFYAEWTVSGQAIVDTQSFMGNDIMLEVDREKGTLSFTKGGEPYAIPIIPSYNENNIKITATKEAQKGFAQVVDSSCSLTADGRIYLAGGTNGNVLMCAKSENPLYFPLKSTTDIGGIEPITALSVQDKKIIAFKDNETYLVALRKGKRINEVGLLADNDRLFKGEDTLSPELISKSVGCKNKNTICKIKDKTVWLGADCEVYLLNNTGFDRISVLSHNLKTNYDFEFMDALSVSDGSYYILFSVDKAFACDIRDIDKPKWYSWQFGRCFKFCGGFYKNGRVMLWCDADGSGVSYIATLNGENDVEIYYNEDREIQADPIAINSYLQTGKYEVSGQNHKNTFESVHIAVSGRGRVEIKVNNVSTATVDLRLSAEDYDKGEYKSVVLRPHLYDTEAIQLYVSSDSDFAIGDIELFYRKTGQF